VYKDPIVYRVCLNEAHPTLWSIKEKETPHYNHCGQPGTIKSRHTVVCRAAQEAGVPHP